jgi:putative transposase
LEKLNPKNNLKIKMMEPLHPGSYYHIYNHANGEDNLFLTSSNYYFFLSKYQMYVSPIVHTLAYCLMPNHFHFLVKIKNEDEILKFSTGKLALKIKNNDVNLISLYISKQFAKLFSSYSQSFNKLNERMGSLFIKNFKRKCANEDLYRRELISYIHMNPVKSGFVDHPSEWIYSSYNDIQSDFDSFLLKSEVIDLFGTVDDMKIELFQSPGLWKSSNR